MGLDDLEQVRLFVEKQFSWPKMAKLEHGHITLARVRPFLREEDFNSFLKFAFVRNPFDRFVSYCALETANSSTRGGYHQSYDQQLIDGVTQLYSKHLSQFGYGF